MVGFSAGRMKIIWGVAGGRVFCWENDNNMGSSWWQGFLLGEMCTLILIDTHHAMPAISPSTLITAK